MRFLDLLAMSVNNLKRRKLRTFLTVLGVIIGTASVVIMVSLGVGLNDLLIKQYASYGDMTLVTVFSNNYYSGSASEENMLTDETAAEFEKLEHVESVSPRLQSSVIIKQGVYIQDTTVYGVTRKYLEGMPMAEGKLADPGDSELKFYYGNQVRTRFDNEKTGESFRNMETPPNVDLIGEPVFVIFDVSAYDQSRNSSDSGVKPPKKYLVPTGGIGEGGDSDYNTYSYGVYADIDLLKAELKRIFKKKQIPGQPTNSKGKPYPYFIYDQMMVFVDDMDNVTEVQKKLSDMGYQTDSQMEWIEQAQQTYGIIQLVLGGIGAVSLFVAAIGIANTMMMSIYERTKEIGVIKVLGCDLRNIRNMFLIESGFIGFMGGVAGLLISYAGGYALNHFLSLGQAMMGVDGDISRIPLWLAGSAIVFAVFVGMAAGFFPSLRAMRLSPLAAIRNE